jgi:intracellular sulfur oxidation DsrE/DsrF family protein
MGLGLPLAAAAEQASVAEDQWLAALQQRKHRTFLDVRGYAVDGAPFRRTTALHTVLMDSYATPASDIGIAFGAHGTGLAFVLDAAFWSEFGVAEYVAKALRDADAAALRAGAAAAPKMCADGVAGLMGKDMRVLACRNTIARWSRELGAAGQLSADAVREQLLAHLLPGVEPVPAMIAAASVAQARGFGYIAIE